MTFKQLLKHHKVLVNLYLNYLRHGDINFEQSQKLINEIARINHRTELINALPIARLNEDSNDYTITKTH